MKVKLTLSPKGPQVYKSGKRIWTQASPHQELDGTQARDIYGKAREGTFLPPVVISDKPAPAPVAPPPKDALDKAVLDAAAAGDQDMLEILTRPEARPEADAKPKRGEK